MSLKMTDTLKQANEESRTRKWDGKAGTFSLYRESFEAWVADLGETDEAAFRGQGVFEGMRCNPEIRAELQEHDLDECLFGRKTTSEKNVDAKLSLKDKMQVTHNRVCEKMHREILETLEAKPLKLLMSVECPRGDGVRAWKELGDTHRSDSASNTMHLLKRLTAIRMKKPGKI